MNSPRNHLVPTSGRFALLAIIAILFLATLGSAEVIGERPVSSPAYGPPLGYRYNVASASDGHDFLVAWIDSLRNRASEMRIYASRVSAIRGRAAGGR